MSTTIISKLNWWLVPLLLLLLLFPSIIILNKEFLGASRRLDELVDGYERIITSWTRTRVILETRQNVDNDVQKDLIDDLDTIRSWVDSEEFRRMRQFTEISESVDYLQIQLSHMKDLYQHSPNAIRVEHLTGIDEKFVDIRAVMGLFRNRLDRGFSFLVQAQVLLMLLLMVLIVIAMEDRTRQQLNIEASRRIQTETARAQEEERNRIALDLHDDIAQELSWMRLKMAGSDTSPDQIEIIDKMIGKIRNISLNLRTPDFQTEFFDDAIKDLIITAEQNSNLQIKYLPGNKHPDVRPEIYGQLYRILQECLNNARKHAGDCRVFIEIQEEAKVLYLEYRDDGKGMDIAELGDNDRLGLPGIRNRVRMMGGKLDIKSSSGKGFSLSCRVPVKLES